MGARFARAMRPSLVCRVMGSSVAEVESSVEVAGVAAAKVVSESAGAGVSRSPGNEVVELGIDDTLPDSMRRASALTMSARSIGLVVVERVVDTDGMDVSVPVLPSEGAANPPPDAGSVLVIETGPMAEVGSFGVPLAANEVDIGEFSAAGL